ncbi:MAG: hypothetical protein NVS9B13_00560 [Candidatus Acidiferrum sp.]
MLKSVPLGVLALLLSLPGSAGAQANSTVTVRLMDTLDTASTQRGDTFNATLASPLVWQNHVVAQRGAPVTGRVTQVVSAGWFKRSAIITLSLGSAQARSGSLPVQTGDLTIKADSQAKRNLLIIGGTAVAGAVLGGAAGGGKGAAIGAAAGAGAGTVGAYVAGNQEIVLPAETLLTFHVSSVTIGPKEVARLQSASPRNEPVYARVDSYPVVVRRRHHGEDDEDDDDQGQDENHQYRRRYPERIEVFFISEHRAKVGICWPDGVEYVYLRGDDLDEIIEPLSERMHISVAVIRPRVRIKREDD